MLDNEGSMGLNYLILLINKYYYGFIDSQNVQQTKNERNHHFIYYFMYFILSHIHMHVSVTYRRLYLL